MYVIALAQALCNPSVHSARAAHRSVRTPEARAHLDGRAALSLKQRRHPACRLPAAARPDGAIRRPEDQNRSLWRGATKALEDGDKHSLIRFHAPIIVCDLVRSVS